MPMIQTTTYTCDQCGATVELPGTMGGGPGGWLNLTQAGTLVALWFDRWECVRDYATEKAPAPEPVSP